MEDGPERTVFWRAAGELILKKGDIKKITRDTDEDNLLMMADAAKAKNDNVRAYYLYERVFRLNTDSRRAIEGMTELQNALEKNSATDQVVTYHERYGPGTTGLMDDKETLSENARKTEEVARLFGLLLGASDSKSYFRKIKVLDVIQSSRAARAGAEIDDYLVSVEGTDTGYVGLFTAVDLLLERSGGPVRVTFEKERSLWLGGEAGLDAARAPELAGFSMKAGAEGIVVSYVKEYSLADRAGLKAGDEVISLNNVPVGTKSYDDVLKQLDVPGPRSIEITVRRKVFL